MANDKKDIPPAPKSDIPQYYDPSSGSWKPMIYSGSQFGWVSPYSIQALNQIYGSGYPSEAQQERMARAMIRMKIATDVATVGFNAFTERFKEDMERYVKQKEAIQNRARFKKQTIRRPIMPRATVPTFMEIFQSTFQKARLTGIAKVRSQRGDVSDLASDIFEQSAEQFKKQILAQYEQAQKSQPAVKKQFLQKKEQTTPLRFVKMGGSFLG